MLDWLSKDHLLSWSLINSNVVECSRPPRGFEMDSDFCRDPGRPHRQQSVGHCVQGGLIKSLVTDSDSGWLRREVDCSLFPPALFLHISMNFTIFLSLIFLSVILFGVGLGKGAEWLLPMLREKFGSKSYKDQALPMLAWAILKSPSFSWTWSWN